MSGKRFGRLVAVRRVENKNGRTARECLCDCGNLHVATTKDLKDGNCKSGIHAYYEPEELVGKTLIAITNLPPRKMMGIESCGMLLSAVNNLKDSEDEELHLIMVDNHIPAGAKLY